MAFLIDGQTPPTETFQISDLTIKSLGETGKGGIYSWTRMNDGSGHSTKFTGKPGFVLIADSETANTHPINHKPVRISFV